VTRTALIFGYGHIGKAFADAVRAQGFTIVATARDPIKREALKADGVTAIDPANCDSIAADVILITAAPTDDGCPAFPLLGGTKASWIGYLSTTGVYGDRNGGWVFEESALVPTSAEARRRVAAEAQWLRTGAHIFRLPGLYGPGRNVIERLKEGTATRVHKPGHVFSRLYHDDCAAALLASIRRPRSGGIYNLCDDEPASAEAVLLFACEVTGMPVPPKTPVTPSMARFYADNKRVSNARAKAELGWLPTYPTYREGLRAIYAQSQSV